MQLTSCVKQEDDEEATTTCRMDSTLSDFHVVLCNANCMFRCSQPADVSGRCLWTRCLFQPQTPLQTAKVFVLCWGRRNLRNFTKRQQQILSHSCIHVNFKCNILRCFFPGKKLEFVVAPLHLSFQSTSHLWTSHQQRTEHTLNWFNHLH